MAEWISETRCKEILGKDLAKIFIHNFGGKCLYVPQRPSKKHAIARSIGLVGMAALTRIYGGFTIEIACTHSKDKASYIIDLLNAGVSRNQIAAMLEVSVRYVSYVNRRYRKICADSQSSAKTCEKIETEKNG